MSDIMSAAITLYASSYAAPAIVDFLSRLPGADMAIALASGGSTGNAAAITTAINGAIIDIVIMASEAVFHIKALQNDVNQLEEDMKQAEEKSEEQEAKGGEAGEEKERILDPDLLDELANSGVKYNSDEIVAIGKTADGDLVWLENGTKKAGLNHIISEHADDFMNVGITREQIPDYIMNAIENGEVVGYQGRGTGRPVFEFIYNGETRQVAITVGSNGFIVGANPR